MPRYVRPGASSSSVAAALAVTTGSRLSAFVTQVPRRMRCVAPATAASVTHGSRNSAGESQIPIRS
jgi:hypothetical protein